jgi:hypothetical protein
MDIIRLYQDFSIDFVTEDHKHAREGWVNVECPFCTGNPGYHLGWNIEEEYFFCWRCGWHPPVRTISTLLNVPVNEAIDLLHTYEINRTVRVKEKKQSKLFRFPLGTNITGLQGGHYDYLRKRGFDPAELIQKWKLQATGPLGELGGVDYRFRIIIPYTWNGEVVSFDSRDITGKQTARYKACPAEYETISHKEILYGNQEAWTPTGICVEGPTDVWRLGEHAFAVSGIQYTQKQVRVISQTFRRVAVIFDDEPQAQRQAKKLVAELKFRGVDAWNIKIKGDPGDLEQDEANELIKSIMK